MRPLKKGDSVKILFPIRGFDRRKKYYVDGFISKGRVVKHNPSYKTAKLVGNEHCVYGVRVKDSKTGKKAWISNVFLGLKKNG